MRSFAALSALLLLSLPAAHASDDPSIAGFVTRVASPNDFDVDGLHVLVNSVTTLQSRNGDKLTPLSSISPFLGQFATVSGKVDRNALTIASVRVVLFAPQPFTVSGSAIIDLVPPPSPPILRVRADGRNLQISADILDHPVKLSPAAAAPATAADLHTNVWIDYTASAAPMASSLSTRPPSSPIRS